MFSIYFSLFIKNKKDNSLKNELSRKNYKIMANDSVKYSIFIFQV